MMTKIWECIKDYFEGLSRCNFCLTHEIHLNKLRRLNEDCKSLIEKQQEDLEYQHSYIRVLEDKIESSSNKIKRAKPNTQSMV